MFDHANAFDTLLGEEAFEFADARGAGSDDGVGNVEGQGVPAKGAGEARDARKRAAARGNQRRSYGINQHSAEQAAAAREDLRRAGIVKLGIKRDDGRIDALGTGTTAGVAN